MSRASESRRARHRAERQLARRIEAEAGGVYAVHTFDLADPAVWEKTPVVAGLLNWAAAVEAKGCSALCLCCDGAEFGPGHGGPRLIAFFHARGPAVSAARASGICQRCANRPDIDDRIVAAYRRLLPDLRVLDAAHLHETEGRA